MNESQVQNPVLAGQLVATVPAPIRQALAVCNGPLYFSGGLVRDWLLGQRPVDIDLTVSAEALALGRELARRLKAAYVPLSADEGVSRVVWGDFCIDISQFREGTTSIEADLGRRDFTVNALALAFDPREQRLAEGGRLIDPLGGLADLRLGRIRLTHDGALTADPLRLLRAYRFRAAYGWEIEPRTRAAIKRQAGEIGRVSGERLAAEFDRLFLAPAAYPAIADLAADGLLVAIFPEFGPAIGLRQPSSHHLDVFGHSLEAVRRLEEILAQPADFFPGWEMAIAAYLARPRQLIRLKYAALLHDLGKTVTYADKDGRPTFYNHDQAAIPLLAAIGHRLRFSNDDRRRIGQLVGQHMWPFHLYNASLKTRITPKAILKLGKAAADDLIGLFLLVMADSLAGQGPGKPAGMEEGIAALFGEVYQTYATHLAPLLATPLLTGDDLIGLGLAPGPLFKELLDGLEEQRAVNPGLSRDQALRWAADYSRQRGDRGPVWRAGD